MITNHLICALMTPKNDRLNWGGSRTPCNRPLRDGVLRGPAWCALMIALLVGSSGLSAQTTASAPDPMRVLGEGVAKRGEGPLRDVLRKESLVALDARRKAYEALKTADDIKTYQYRLRGHFIESLGGFPERTPLNARVTGELRGEGFRIEKILFESQPGFVVSGLLYLPLSGKAPFPAVLMPCGHSGSGKAAYQLPAIALATHGIAVFCFDPIGQGERLQVRRDAKPRNVRAPNPSIDPTNEHTVLASAPILLGRNLATDMIWDGMRAVDYLETRPDIDAKRIACAGNSGGGMMTSYLIALEPRLVAATPGCFVTTSARKNEHPGPGDPEQDIFGQYTYGMDIPDYLVMAAPRPVLILSATRDYVPIAGAWEAFRDAKRVYTRLGYPERIDLVETDAPHGYSVQLREGTVRWMRRWMESIDEPVFEKEAHQFKNEELHCAPEGSVLKLPGARSYYDLNRERAAALAEARKPVWNGLTDTARRERVRQVAGIRKGDALAALRIESKGTFERSGTRIERLVFKREGDVPLPALRFIPENPSGRTCLYVHGGGKQADAGEGGPIHRLVEGGTEVIAVDLRGFGETSMGAWRTRPAAVAGDNGAEFLVAYMLGKSLVGLRAEDILTVANAWRMRPEGPSGPVDLVALDDATIPALHAAAVEPTAFSSVRLHRAIDSWQRVVVATIPHRQFESTIHGVLRTYDLPDLVSLAGKVEYIDPADGELRSSGSAGSQR